MGERETESGAFLDGSEKKTRPSSIFFFPPVSPLFLHPTQVKEILGTCVSVGCTVDGEDPREVQAKIDEGEVDVPEE